jgi:protein-disulfide isomerase
VAAKRALAETLEQVRGEYQLDVQELDLLEHSELAAHYGIMATPALIINGERAFVGTVTPEKLREKLAAAAQGTSHDK